MTIRVAITSRTFPSVREAFSKAEIHQEESDKTAILYWFDSLKEAEKVFTLVAPYQVVNRIPNINVLCRKAALARILERLEPQFSSLFQFVPKTFILPFQSTKFIRALSKNRIRYIIKPDSGSLGQGIMIVEPDTEYQPDETMAVAQQYIDSFLLDNKKFDFRIYVLVASVDPLEIYVYRDGLARFCLEEIDSNSMYGQLTNVAINHDSRILTEILERMKIEKNVDIDRLWKNIDEVIALTIISGYSYILTGVEKRFGTNRSYSRCFQVLGFDILLDKDAKPYLLEVNYRPSLDTHFSSERRLKVEMIKAAVMIGAPLRRAQQALLSRKWGWSEESWQSFLNITPEIAKEALAEKEIAVKKSKYCKIWPSDDPEKVKWQDVFETAKKLTIEPLPGLAPT
jgi:hypothetical protein